MKAKFIELTNGEVYLARTEPETASEDPLTDRELVILDLHKQIEDLKKANNLVIADVSQQRELLMQAYKDGFQAATDSIIGANEMVKNKTLQ